METKNAIIKSATIEIEGHGLLTAMIKLDVGDGVRGFGGHTFYSSSWKRPGPNALALFVWRVFDIAGVDAWHKLAGRTIRVRGTDAGIDAIGHIVKDDWFNPREEFERLKGQ